MKVLSSIALVVFTLANPATGQGKVWVIDALGAPGSDFTAIQPAVDVAADGDIILVKGRIGEQYEGVFVPGRSLTIVGELDTSGPFPALSPPVVGPIWVQNVAANQRFTLRGISIRDALPTAPVLKANLTVTGCAGEVFVEDVSMARGSTGTFGQPAPPALHVANSDRFSVVHSSGVGSRGTQGAIGGQGLVVFSSAVSMHHSQFTGGEGSPVAGVIGGPPLDAALGGEGARIIGGDVISIGSAFRGGMGGRGIEDAAMNCLPSADGGTGAVVTFNAVNVGSLTEIDSSLAGGLGGGAPGINCPAGVEGQDLFLQGTHTIVPASSPEFITNSPVREGEDLHLIFRSAFGDFQFLAIGSFNTPLFDPLAFDGLLHIAPPQTFRFMGTIPANGELLRSFTINELGLGVDGILLDLQGIQYTQGPQGFRLSSENPSSVLLLDASF